MIKKENKNKKETHKIWEKEKKMDYHKIKKKRKKATGKTKGIIVD